MGNKMDKEQAKSEQAASSQDSYVEPKDNSASAVANEESKEPAQLI